MPPDLGEILPKPVYFVSYVCKQANSPERRSRCYRDGTVIACSAYATPTPEEL